MRRFLIVGLLCIAFAEAGPGKFVAVLETALNDKGALSHSEQMFLTDELRSQAVKALPAEMGFTIMTRENIQSMLPPDKSLESCSGTSCLVDIGRNIAADYVAQGRVGRFGKDLTLTVELYETQGAKLVGSFTAKNASADGLLSGIGKDAPGLFGRIRGSGWLPASVQNTSGVVSPAFADEVGTVVTVAFTDGPGAVLIDGKMACTYKDKCAKELTKGEHQVALSRDGYRDSAFVIGVPKGSNRYVVALVSKSGVLTIRAQDGKSGDAVVADVIVDGRTVGQTPWSGPVAMTAKSVGLRAEGYEDASVSERPAEGKKQQVQVNMEAKAQEQQSRSQQANRVSGNSFIDSRDNQTYKTVVIGTQTWMAENLNYRTGNSWCYDNSADSCEKYGRLYTWDAAMKACPVGWRLPANDEWTMLENAVGGSSTAGTYLKATSGWKSRGVLWWNKKGDGMDAYGFSALPAGTRSVNVGFNDVGNYAYFWSVTEYGTGFAYIRYLGSSYAVMGTYGGNKYGAFSVRCLKD